MLALALMYCTQDEPFLRLHLPAMVGKVDPANVVAASERVDDGASACLRTLGIEPFYIPFSGHWADFLNQLLQRAQIRGYSKVIRLDPDELVFPDTFSWTNAQLNQASMIAFPRWNFWYDRCHVMGDWPDYQWRAWRLDRGIQYVGKVHEQPMYQGPDTLVQDRVPIFHYGNVSMTAIRRRWLYYQNYDRRERGLPPLAEVPPDANLSWGSLPFDKPQPLDPAVVGPLAPFDE